VGEPHFLRLGVISEEEQPLEPCPRLFRRVYPTVWSWYHMVLGIWGLL